MLILRRTTKERDNQESDAYKHANTAYNLAYNSSTRFIYLRKLDSMSKKEDIPHKSISRIKRTAVCIETILFSVNQGTGIKRPLYVLSEIRNWSIDRYLWPPTECTGKVILFNSQNTGPATRHQE